MTYVFLPNHFVTCCANLQCVFPLSEKENYLQDSVYGPMPEMLQGRGACQAVWLLFP